MKRLISAIIAAAVVAFLGYIFVYCAAFDGFAGFREGEVSYLQAWGVYICFVIAGFNYYFGNRR